MPFFVLTMVVIPTVGRFVKSRLGLGGATSPRTKPQTPAQQQQSVGDGKQLLEQTDSAASTSRGGSNTWRQVKHPCPVHGHFNGLNITKQSLPPVRQTKGKQKNVPKKSRGTKLIPTQPPAEEGRERRLYVLFRAGLLNVYTGLREVYYFPQTKVTAFFCMAQRAVRPLLSHAAFGFFSPTRLQNNYYCRPLTNTDTNTQTRQAAPEQEPQRSNSAGEAEKVRVKVVKRRKESGHQESGAAAKEEAKEVKVEVKEEVKEETKKAAKEEKLEVKEEVKEEVKKAEEEEVREVKEEVKDETKKAAEEEAEEVKSEVQEEVQENKQETGSKRKGKRGGKRRRR